MFDSYSQRARRAVFFALYEAKKMLSAAIEPDHLLLGFLREDPVLFQVITGRDSSIVDEIREETKSIAKVERATAATDNLPLSILGKRVVVSAERFRRELDQKQVGTQHLLLAIAKLPDPADNKIQRFFGRTLSNIPTLLRKYGITGQTLIERIREGDLTPQTAVVHDEILLLNAQVSALASIAEFNQLIDSNSELLSGKFFLSPILDALVSKGIFSKEEAGVIIERSDIKEGRKEQISSTDPDA